MASDTLITGTLNNLLSLVISGVDYASKIAEKTKKSIPVVYKQLDILLKSGVISKKRIGKKVVYEPNWVKLSDIASHVLIFDFSHVGSLLYNNNRENSVLYEEYNYIMKSLPGDILNNLKSIKGIISNFFSCSQCLKVIKKLYYQAFETGKNIALDKMDFNGTIDYIADAFGMVPVKDHERILKEKLDLKKAEKEKVSLFMKLCRLRYIKKKLDDPRETLFV